MVDIERKYSDVLVVVGVHSAKFRTERSTQAIRHAVLRHGVRHPVVNDRDHRLWQQYAVRAWPTLVFVDPAGKVIGRHEGEVRPEQLEPVIQEMVREFDAAGLLDRRPLHFRPEVLGPAALAFPGKVLADQAGGHLIVSDSGHHRLIVARPDGQVLHVIGDGMAGLVDGESTIARFHYPQGLASDGQAVYVADTENHAIRRVDLATWRVETVAGTGHQAMEFPARGGSARTTSLNSPWDVVVLGGMLYIAMAGLHQIWVLDLAAGEVRPFVGSGHEGLEDGPLDLAQMAQPSGITTDGTRLYVADSESSAIRAIDLSPAGQVRTIVGTGLFDFGDVDGVGEWAKLQHPQGLSWHKGELLVADTYNHKVKRVLPTTRASLTWLGSGQPGHMDGQGSSARFDGPGGLSVGAGRLYIADTNNHVVRVADLATGMVSTLVLRGLP